MKTGSNPRVLRRASKPAIFEKMKNEIRQFATHFGHHEMKVVVGWRSSSVPSDCNTKKNLVQAIF